MDAAESITLNEHFLQIVARKHPATLVSAGISSDNIPHIQGGEMTDPTG
jgi:hypothetical protein